MIVTAIDTRKPLWSGTIDALPDRESIAEMAAAMAETAVELIRLTDPDTAMDDLLVTSRGWFHVLRVVEDTGAGGYVAHLLLDRREANLAMARREFRELIGRVIPVPSEPIPEATEPETVGPETVELQLAGALPRRKPSTTGPWDRGTPQEDPAPSWFAKYAGHPFESDGRTVERVRDGLHRLV
ncbi:hypothetical protein ACFQ1L_00315 [Phytohabitans flavus]|uniref:Uncharacterized protein n=1 Tax=Phytohabitans flavus TaxID=1076124 RepID=A0A6F8Y5N0_9ACTN|nr:hypothetical protein [Phytohabitans flavus]BCB81422.1 hypothetical protein Pflav_078320 [Phytohabitans flavus]